MYFGWQNGLKGSESLVLDIWFLIFKLGGIEHEEEKNNM